MALDPQQFEKLKAQLALQKGQAAAPSSTGKDLAIGAAKGVAETFAGGDVLGTMSRMAGGKTQWTGQTWEEQNKAMEASNPTQQIGKYGVIAAEIATPFVTKTLAHIAPKLIDIGSEIASTKGKQAIDYAKDVITPKKTPLEAAAQIGQGQTKTTSSVARTLATVDTKDVKTYKDLLGRIDTKIPELARQVDAELIKDTGVYKLPELAVKTSTKGGREVATDYVSRALDDLKNLYKSIGDDTKYQDIEEILAHAQTNGLTRKEVNDISRVYGQEFGTKAFGKTGEALTSTNAQAFENTRSGLKDVARQGLGGEEAKAIDSTLSAMYDTQRLVAKNVEAVAKLQQRIQQRGLIEKAGYLVSKYADILTGGSIRGFVGGILPRGAGYKVMNALDLEDALRGNLDVIEKALAEKTNEGFLKVLQKSNPVFKNAGPNV